MGFFDIFKKHTPAQSEPVTTPAPEVIKTPKKRSSKKSYDALRAELEEKIRLEIEEKVKKEQAEKDRIKPPEVSVLKLDFDINNPRVGSFELDWNQEFISLLTQHGYNGNTPEDKVDAWLNDICRTIVTNQMPNSNVQNLESSTYITKKIIGDGKVEIR